MAAMLKKALSVVAVLLIAASTCAAGPEVRSDHPDTYVVKKGDTLWDISGMFLKNPWYWPEIWQANPQIANPHLIYPGDAISLVYIDGEPRLMVNGEAPEVAPKARDDGASEAIPPLPLSSIRQFLSRPRVLSEEEWQSAPYFAAVEENRIVGHAYQLGYARRFEGELKVGQQFAIMRPTVVYTDVPAGWFWQKDKRKVESRSWQASDQWHWSLREWVSERGAETLGHEVVEIGMATVSVLGDPATLYVTYSEMEVRRGDLLLPVEEAPYPLNFYPHAPANTAIDARVIGLTGGFDRAGPNDVIVLSRGAQDGVEVGEVYSIYQPGEVVHDEVAYPKGSYRAFFNPHDKKVKLPDEFNGHVMVFRTFDRISYGLVMNGVKPIPLGARLDAPTQL